jgi:predicted amidophosphoribosyltransferase
MFLVDVLSGLVRPTSCLACGVPAAWPCCARCLPPDPGDVGPWPLAVDPELACWALGPYRDALRAAVLAGKFDGQPAALTELGRRLGDALAEGGIGADQVTYVAARRAAGQPRDHAERIARGLAEALDLPVVDLLAPARGRDLGRARGRDRGRARQASLRPPPTRPPPVAKRRLAGGRVLLVDDLVTSGATLAGAAAALRLAGARQVEGAALATAPAALAPTPAALAPTPAALAPTPAALAPTPAALAPTPAAPGLAAAARGLDPAAPGHASAAPGLDPTVLRHAPAIPRAGPIQVPSGPDGAPTRPIDPGHGGRIVWL